MYSQVWMCAKHPEAFFGGRQIAAVKNIFNYFLTV